MQERHLCCPTRRRLMGLAGAAVCWTVAQEAPQSRLMTVDEGVQGLKTVVALVDWAMLMEAQFARAQSVRLPLRLMQQALP